MTRKERAPRDEAGRTQGGTRPPRRDRFPGRRAPVRGREAARGATARRGIRPRRVVADAPRLRRRRRRAPARLSAEGRRGAHRPSREENPEENPERAAEVRTPLTPEITTRERGGRKHAPGRARGSAGADATRDDTSRRVRPRAPPAGAASFLRRRRTRTLGKRATRDDAGVGARTLGKEATRDGGGEGSGRASRGEAPARDETPSRGGSPPTPRTKTRPTERVDGCGSDKVRPRESDDARDDDDAGSKRDRCTRPGVVVRPRRALALRRVARASIRPRSV